MDAHLDDLQSELEAGSRALEKFDRHAFQVLRQLAQSAIADSLRRQMAELKRSIAQQQATLRELRAGMRQLRNQTDRGTNRR